MKCGGRWNESSIYKEITNTHIGKKRGVRRWLTKSQMRQHFDADIVEAIAHRKKSDPELAINEVRSHPEHEQLEQFLVLIEDEEEQVEENRVSDMFQLKQTKKSSSCNVTSDEDDDDEEESSGDEDRTTLILIQFVPMATLLIYSSSRSHQFTLSYRIPLRNLKRRRREGSPRKARYAIARNRRSRRARRRRARSQRIKDKAKTVEDEQKEARKELVRKAKKARPANNVFILVQLDFPLVEFVNLLYIYIALPGDPRLE